MELAGRLSMVEDLIEKDEIAWSPGVIPMFDVCRYHERIWRGGVLEIPHETKV